MLLVDVLLVVELLVEELLVEELLVEELLVDVLLVEGTCWHVQPSLVSKQEKPSAQAALAIRQSLSFDEFEFELALETVFDEGVVLAVSEDVSSSPQPENVNAIRSEKSTLRMGKSKD